VLGTSRFSHDVLKVIFEIQQKNERASQRARENGGQR
jgi:hypothetical protein